MQKSNQRLASFVSEITAGEAAPIPRNEEASEEAIWSGVITEISAATYSFHKEGHAGSPKMVQDDWFIFSNDKVVTAPGILFWQNGDQFFARRMDQEQWDKFIKAAKVTRKFW